jgi:hypothetical protein
MRVDTRLEDEHGSPIAVLISPSWLTNWLISCADLSQTTTCMRFINLYGDTLFNPFQVRVLGEELAALESALSDEVIERTYDKWLSRFEKTDSAIFAPARSHPKPTRSLLIAHISAIQQLVAQCLRGHHLYLRFIGD